MSEMMPNTNVSEQLNNVVLKTSLFFEFIIYHFQGRAWTWQRAAIVEKVNNDVSWSRP